MASIPQQIKIDNSQLDFIARGLASAEAALESGTYALVEVLLKKSQKPGRLR